VANIFWDTNLFIYLLEGSAGFGTAAKNLRRRMLQRNDRLFTSALTIGEVLVKPLSTGNRMLADRGVRPYSQRSRH
jgi:predicted nucleic acid-binding protein